MNTSSVITRLQTMLNLSARELEVVHLGSLGYSDKKIATALSISKFTVASHWQNILLRNGAVNRTLVIARYSAALARNEINADALMNLPDVTLARTPRGSAISQSLRRSMEKAVQDCRALSAEGLTGSDDVFRRYLQECVMLTDSASGFLAGIRQDADHNYYVSASATFNLEPGTLSPIVITGWNEVNPQPMDYGCWFADVLCTKAAHFANEQSAEHSVVSEHLQTPIVESFVGLPLVRDGIVVGLLCLANRPGGYDESIVKFLEPLLKECSTFIEAWVSQVDRLALDRKIADTALMLKTVTDELTNGFIYASSDGTVLHVNRMFLDTFGLKSDDNRFAGRPVSSLLEECLPSVCNAELLTNIIQSLVSTGESRFGQTIHLQNSRIIEIDSIGVRVEDTCTGLIWKLSDVTKLELDRLAFGEVLQHSRDGIIVITDDGVVQHWNKRAESIFGYSAGEALGQMLVELVIPDRYQNAHLEGLKRHRETGVSRVMGQLVNIVGKRKCGAEVNIELMLSCIDAGDHPRYCAYIREVLD